MSKVIQYSRTDIDRVVFISDIHLGIKNASIDWIENMTNYFKHFFIKLIKKYKAQGEKLILVIAGDFFENRQHIDINILNIGANVMTELAEELEVFVSVGNHDIYKKKDIDVTSLRLFKQFKNVNVVDELSEILLKGNKKMLIVPWIGDNKAETALLSKYKNEDFIIMHTDICGLKFDNGREIVNGTNISMLDKTKIYSGHIHKRQENDKVVYLGSPYQTRRSDIGNEKGVYSIKLEDDNAYQEYVQNDYSPKFLRMKLVDILEWPMSMIKKYAQNNYVDIIVKRSHMNDVNIAKLMDVMDECNTKKIEVILDKNEDDVTQSSVVARKDMTITEIVEEKLKALNISEDDVKALLGMNNNYLALAAEMLGSEIEYK